MSDKNNKSISGFALLSILLTVVFVTLKLTKVIIWSWFWVISPIPIYIIFVFIITFICVIIENKKWR